MIELLRQVLEQQGHMLEQQGRMLERQTVHTGQLQGMVEKVDGLDRKVTQHRTGWQILVWVGGVALALVALYVGITKR